jgi:hypothetical protein
MTGAHHCSQILVEMEGLANFSRLALNLDPPK